MGGGMGGSTGGGIGGGMGGRWVTVRGGMGGGGSSKMDEKENEEEEEEALITCQLLLICEKFLSSKVLEYTEKEKVFSIETVQKALLLLKTSYSHILRRSSFQELFQVSFFSVYLLLIPPPTFSPSFLLFLLDNEKHQQCFQSFPRLLQPLPPNNQRCSHLFCPIFPKPPKI